MPSGGDRSQRSIEYLLGEAYEGTISCDGWRSYGAYSANLQRCWAHLLTKSAFVADRYDEAVAIDEELHRIYEDLLEFLEAGPPPPERAEKRKVVTDALEELADREVAHEDVQALLTYLDNGMGHWLTFVTNPAVEPTNNRAERALRKVVTLRKIIGSIRSEDGRYVLETVMTAIETWKARGQNPRDEMLRVLERS